MKKIALLTAIGLIGLSANFASAQNNMLTKEMIDHANMIGKNALKSSVTEDVITSLTTEVGHRLAGTANDKKAENGLLPK